MKSCRVVLEKDLVSIMSSTTTILEEKRKMRSKKRRSPKLTRLEKMTKGLMLSTGEVKSKFTVREVEGKGRAIFLHSRIIRKDSFVLEYEGDVITHEEATFREKIYETNDEGCYILFFRFKGRRLAIDATRRFDSYARYLNHSKEPNIRFHPPLMLDLTGNGVPRIAAYALRDIHDGEEIVFDYGVRDGQISWLQNKKRCHTSELSDSNDDSSSSSSDDDDEGATSERDVVMSITRTPVKFARNDSSISDKAKKTLSLAPSKYLSQRGISSMPPSLSIPSGGHGIRFLPLPVHSSMGKNYIASIEGLGQPLKILQSFESKKSNSVISLSASDDSSKLSPPPSSPSEPSGFIVPLNAELSSTSKVLEWQKTINQNLPEKPDFVNDIKILDVTSLSDMGEAVQQSSSLSHPSCNTGYTLQHSTGDTIWPCISNIINGNSVPKSFVPTLNTNSKEQMSYSYSHTSTSQISNSTYSQQSPNKSNVPISPLTNHTATTHQTKTSPQKRNVDSYAGQPFVNASKQQKPTDLTICLSDSDDDDDVLILPFQNACDSFDKNIPNSLKAAQSEQSCVSNHVTRVPSTQFDKQSFHKSSSVRINDVSSIGKSQHACDNKIKSTPFSWEERPINQSGVEATRLSNIPSLSSESRRNNSVPTDQNKLCDDEIIEMDDNETDDDNESDIEIISCGEVHSSTSTYSDKKCLLPSSSPQIDVVSLSHKNPLPAAHQAIPNNLFESSRSGLQSHVAIVSPYSVDKTEEVEPEICPDVLLSDEEKRKMKCIFQPLIQSSESLSLSSVENTISENFDFFNTVIERGVSVDAIRKLVWTFFKVSNN